MKNAEWIIKQGYSFTDLNIKINGEAKSESLFYKPKEFYVCLKGEKIDSLEAYTDDTCLALKMWLEAEHKEPILDDAERQYLSAVIKPFRERVVYLKKYKGTLNFGAKYECIEGQVRSEWDKNLIFGFELTPFRTETMYKGMKPGREYTLEELGL